MTLHLTVLRLATLLQSLALAFSCSPMNVMVPAYFGDPSSSNAWDSLSSAAAALPNRLVAIANVFNGPGSSLDSSYTSAINSVNTNTGRVIGYVHTSYGSRSSSSVEADVDAWFDFYPMIGGIFFDEAAYTDGEQSYYQSLYNYLKAKNSSSLVVNNPGTSTLESYLVFNGARVADVICTFESGTGALQWTPASWTANYAMSNFYGLFYNTSSSDYADVIKHAYQQNVGWVYVTDDNLPNPWDTLASYFSGEVSYIQNNDQCM